MIQTSSPHKVSTVQILEMILKSRKKKNPAYTKTAFARDMGISQPLLSLIFSGKRTLTTNLAKKVSILLKLTPGEETSLVDSTVFSSKDLDSRIHDRLEEKKNSHKHKEYKNLDFDRFSVLAQWFHMPILALAMTRGFKSKPDWIARRLNISITDARESLERLERLGLLVNDGKGNLKPSERRVELAPKRSESAVREHHVQMMKRAEETMLSQIDDLSWIKREISSLSLAVDPDRITEAKDLVKKFKEDLSALLANGEVSEVYQFNVQLFPLTRSKS